MVGKRRMQLLFSDDQKQTKQEHDETVAEISKHHGEEERVGDDGERSCNSYQKKTDLAMQVAKLRSCDLQ